MAKKYIVYEVDDNSGGEDWGPAILFLLFIAVVYGIYQFFFGDYNDSDFKKAAYLVKAKAGAEELVLKWQGRN